MMNDIECPYCGEEQDINHDDGYGYEEGATHNQQCEKCDKYFTYTTSISYYYESYKADCLNEGGEHDYRPTVTCPVECTRMHCKICDEERQPTELEMIEIKERSEVIDMIYKYGKEGAISKCDEMIKQKMDNINTLPCYDQLTVACIVDEREHWSEIRQKLSKL